MFKLLSTSAIVRGILALAVGVMALDDWRVTLSFPDKAAAERAWLPPPAQWPMVVEAATRTRLRRSPAR
jgi:hypothetical protein